MPTIISSVLTALVVALSVTGSVPTDAHAIQRKPARVAEQAGANVMKPRPPASRPPVAQKDEVEGGATGDGPLNDVQCQQVAAAIELYLEVGAKAQEEGDTASANAALGAAEDSEQGGLQRGCFFTHTA